MGVKIGFSLRAGTRATLVVPPAYREMIGLEYAHSVRHADPPPGLDGPFTLRNGGAAVRFEACPANEPAFSYAGAVGEWTPFSGGFFVARPGCYPIELHVAGRSEPYRRNLPFGGVSCA
jgi:hypothetical protein